MSEDTVDTERVVGADRTPERFVLLGKAGEGGMGIVHRARSQCDGTIVALKVMSAVSASPARFALETSVLAKLEHPNIVRYHSHGFTSDGMPYLAMEWLEGETLSEVLERGPLAPKEVARIGSAIASALAYAHERAVVHRDLKPSNVFLTKDGTVKLLDFGIARLSDIGRGLTKTGEVVGTHGYMAPEQARGDDVIDGRADLFALGCVLYRALAGRMPFPAGDPVAYLGKLLHGAAQPIDQLVAEAPVGLTDLVMHLLEREPADRPADAASVAAMLSGDLDRSAKPTPAARAASLTDRTLASPSDAPRGVPVAPRRSPVVAAVLIVGVLGLGALWLAVRDGRSGSSATTSPSAPLTAPPKDDPTASLRGACREWASVLSRGQRADGTFSGEQHRASSCWDTGQQLFALARARHACGAPELTTLSRGVGAVEAYRLDGGFTGLSFGTKPREEVPAAAWSWLAASALERVAVSSAGLGSASTVVAAAAVRGGYSFYPATDGGALVADPYSTVVGAWATIEATRDPSTDAASRAAVASLVFALQSNPGFRSTAGLEEQALWVLLRSRSKGLVDPPRELIETLADDVVARCGVDASGRCTRAIYDDDALAPAKAHDAGGAIFHLWHPWVSVVTRAMIVDPTLPISPSTRASLVAIARWAEGELTGAIGAVAVAAEYKVAEYLLAVTLLLDD